MKDIFNDFEENPKLDRMIRKWKETAYDNFIYVNEGNTRKLNIKNRKRKEKKK